MQVIIFRHGEKAMLPFDDPELTDRGQRQSKNLIQVVKDGKIPKPDLLQCSPKKRAQGTLGSLASELQIPLELNHLWNEQQTSEKKNEFIQRLTHAIKLLEKLKELEKTVYICTHMDVLESLSQLLHVENSGDISFHLPTGGYLHFQLRTTQDLPQWRFLGQGQLQG